MHSYLESVDSPSLLIDNDINDGASRWSTRHRHPRNGVSRDSPLFVATFAALFAREPFAYGAATREERNGNYNARKMSRESVALDINDRTRVSLVSLYEIFSPSFSLVPCALDKNLTIITQLTKNTPIGRSSENSHFVSHRLVMAATKRIACKLMRVIT